MLQAATPRHTTQRKQHHLPALLALCVLPISACYLNAPVSVIEYVKVRQLTAPVVVLFYFIHVRSWVLLG
jgi:hypothetical protein